MTRTEWHADEWIRDVLVPAVELGLTRAGIVLQAEMSVRMGSEGGGVLRKATKRRTASGSFKKLGKRGGRNVYYPSPPGKFPGVRTGTLRRSMNSYLTGDLEGRTVRIRSAKVGTNVFYGRFLERGTSRMAPRPWAMRSVGLAKDRMNREFTRVVAQSIAARARASA